MAIYEHRATGTAMVYGHALGGFVAGNNVMPSTEFERCLGLAETMAHPLGIVDARSRRNPLQQRTNGVYASTWSRGVAQPG